MSVNTYLQSLASSLVLSTSEKIVLLLLLIQLRVDWMVIFPMLLRKRCLVHILEKQYCLEKLMRNQMWILWWYLIIRMDINHKVS